MKRVQLLTEYACANDGYDTVAEARADAKNLAPGSYLPVTIVTKQPLIVKAPATPTDNEVDWGDPMVPRARKDSGG